jgi:hypothetical protein
MNLFMIIIPYSHQLFESVLEVITLFTTTARSIIGFVARRDRLVAHVRQLYRPVQ